MSKKTDTASGTDNSNGAPQMTDDQLRTAAFAAFDEGAANPDAPYTPPNQVASADVDPGEPDDEDDKDGKGKATDVDDGAGAGDGAGKGAGKDGDGKPDAGAAGKDGKAKPDAEGDGKPAAGKDGKPAAAGEDGKAGEGKALTPEQQAAKDKADDDAAVKDLGLKGKAEERFRSMSNTIREQSRTLEEVGGKDGLARLQRDAADQRAWDEQMANIAATPEQFGQAMGYIAAVNSGDVTALTKAREFLAGELAWLDGQLGITPAGKDPLEGHPDLQEKVRTGAMDKADAEAWANDRNTRNARTKLEERTRTQAEELEAQRAELNTGVNELKTLGATLKAKDGAEVFEAKMAMITPALTLMQSRSKPSEWAGLARELYDKAVYRAKTVDTPKPPRVGIQPNRQTVAASAGQVVRQPTDAMDAFDLGVTEARERGE